MGVLNSFTDDLGIVNYSFKIDGNNYRKDLNILISNLKPTWPVDQLVVKEYSGGLTNKLIGCSKDEKREETILTRIYGPGTDSYIDRNAELRNMKILSKCELGPRIYCKFENGICYEFLPGDIVDSNLLLNEEIFSKVAQLVAKIHSISSESCDQGEGILFKKIHALLDLVPVNYKEKLYGEESDIRRIPKKHILQQEVQFMEKRIKTLCKAKKSKLVFSHNDLLLANIIYNADKNNISFIDYEYSGPNWQAYDIANHFNEYAGVDAVDYSLYPSKEYQQKWLAYYLKTFLNKSDDEDVSEELVESLYEEVEQFSLVSHLYWSIWAVVQATFPRSEFNFAEYACTRFGEYSNRKQKIY